MKELDPLQQFRLDDSVAIVTGASSGLGARFASVLDAVGARVVIAARRQDRLEQVAADLDGRPFVVKCDVTASDDLDRLVETCFEQFGRVDVLVNNAGVADPMPALDETDEHFEWIVDVNLVGQFELSRRIAQAMTVNDGGTIINVASMVGLVASHRIPQASYAAAKGGLISLTRELAYQWASDGVRVNALAPGWFRSELTAEMLDEESGRKYVARGAPLGRPGEEDELDGALLFLASSASSYITGQVLVVDGGWTIV